MKKLINQTTQSSINAETGELIEVTVEKSYSIKNVNVDNFYMTFIENMSGYFKLKSAIDIKVLTKFCCMAEFNTGVVNLTTKLRQETCELLQITTQQLTNSISKLKTKGFLTGEKGTYTVNPKVFWKGTTQEREKLLKSGTLTFNISIE
jgi:hypothetical protein